MKTPIAVLISDIHFTPSTLELASNTLEQALSASESLDIPLIIAGDTLDSKAIIRGECANRLLSIFQASKRSNHVYMLVGNHDMLNEKGKEHSLNFLRPYVTIVDELLTLRFPVQGGTLCLMPYQNSSEHLLHTLSKVPTHSTIIAHQGVQSAFMGHYVQDKTSVPPEVFADYRVISGHYHRAQNIKCGRPRKGAVGLFSYIGTPYTTSFDEAEDGPKGFQILFDDGTLELVPTNLRKHVIAERDISDLSRPIENLNQNDLLWLKVKGTYAELEKLKKKDVADHLVGHQNFKLDKIYTDSPKAELVKSEGQTDEGLLDAIIDNLEESTEQKQYLKALWREVLS